MHVRFVAVRVEDVVREKLFKQEIHPRIHWRLSAVRNRFVASHRLAAHNHFARDYAMPLRYGADGLLLCRLLA